MMNFGSDYSGGSRNSSNRRLDNSGSAKRTFQNNRYVSPGANVPKPRVSGEK